MAWNILHGGNDIENGPQNVIQIIKEINPDVILMVEIDILVRIMKRENAQH